MIFSTLNLLQGTKKLTFDKFKNILLSNSKVREMSDLDEEKAEYLLKRWTGKQIRLIIRVIFAAEAAEAVRMEEAQLVREAQQEGHFTVLWQVEASFQMREVYYNPLSCEKRTVSMSAKRLTSSGGQNIIYILVAAESGWANT